MISKTITYTDFLGNVHIEEFFFNMRKDELIEYEVSIEGGMSATLQTMVDKKSAKDIMSTVKDLILRSYGVLSEDGKRFIKSEQAKEEFYQSEAYSELFAELVTDADAAAAFMNGILPKALVDAATTALAQNPNMQILH